MYIEIEPSVLNRLKPLRIGLFEFTAHVSESSAGFWVEAHQTINSKFEGHTLDKVNKIETIAQTRDAYRKCGKDPNRYRPSADSLIRRIVKGNELYQINSVVDVLNLISVLSGFSIGGYDKKLIAGQIELQIGQAGIEYCGIGRGAINIEGLPVLCDQNGVFGSPTSDSERTMISLGKREILFVFFDFGCHQSLPEYLKLTELLLTKYAAAENIRLEFLKY